MSTRSYIAMQIGDDKFKTVYCHNDSYLTHNGALLLDYYSEPKKLNELLELGDISFLAQNILPDPAKPHSAAERQDGVVVAYCRDSGEKKVEPTVLTESELTSEKTWAEYIYVFNKDHRWVYGKSGECIKDFRDVGNELEKAYAYYGLDRPNEYYGNLSNDTVEYLKELLNDFENESAIQVI